MEARRLKFHGKTFFGVSSCVSHITEVLEIQFLSCTDFKEQDSDSFQWLVKNPKNKLCDFKKNNFAFCLKLEKTRYIYVYCQEKSKSIDKTVAKNIKSDLEEVCGFNGHDIGGVSLYLLLYGRPSNTTGSNALIRKQFAETKITPRLYFLSPKDDTIVFSPNNKCIKINGTES